MREEGAVQAVLSQEKGGGRRGRDVEHPVQMPKGHDVPQAPHGPRDGVGAKLQAAADDDFVETGKRPHLLGLLRPVKFVCNEELNLLTSSNNSISG